MARKERKKERKKVRISHIPRNIPGEGREKKNQVELEIRTKMCRMETRGLKERRVEGAIVVGRE